MPFFARQKITWPPMQFSFHREQKIDDEGFTTFEKVPDNAPLPPVELFDLERQTKAGVTQQQVNTKILGSGVAIADAVEFVENSDNNQIDEVKNG